MDDNKGGSQQNNGILALLMKLNGKFILCSHLTTRNLLTAKKS